MMYDEQMSSTFMRAIESEFCSLCGGVDRRDMHDPWQRGVLMAQMWFKAVHRTPFTDLDRSDLRSLKLVASDTRGGPRIARNARRPRCRWRQQTWRRCSPSRLPYGVYQASHKAPHSHTLVFGRAGPGVRWAQNGNAHGILATRSVRCCSSHMVCPCLLSRRLPYNGRCS
jgi:hypothetical protein